MTMMSLFVPVTRQASRVWAFIISVFVAINLLQVPANGFPQHPSRFSKIAKCTGPDRRSGHGPGNGSRRLGPPGASPAASFLLANPNRGSNDNISGTGSTKSTGTQAPKQRGVYVRPSAVIERGSGFFFPGLEGPRVRLFAGSALLAVTVINHLLSNNTSLFSEALAVIYSFLVLLQGAIEAVKDARVETIAARSTTSSMDDDNASTTRNDGTRRQQLSQQWNPNSGRYSTAASSSYRDKVEWAAASFLALTPATHMMLLRRGGKSNAGTDTGTGNVSMEEISSSSSPTIDYWLGATANTPSDPTTVTSAVASALDTVQASQGGRVALPADHPAVVGIFGGGDEDLQKYRRCVILQRIDNNGCWMVASDDLLASFTKGDLQWLGQLAAYVQ